MNDEISSVVNSEAVSFDSQTFQLYSGLPSNLDNEDVCRRSTLGLVEKFERSCKLPLQGVPSSPGQHFSTVQIITSLQIS